MKVRRFKANFIKASAVSALALGVVSPASAVEFFEFDVNRLIGDPRRGTDEDYVNTIADPGGEYRSPDNIINGTPQVLGSQPGHIESVRVNGGGASTGINIPQPHLLPSSDPRSEYKNIIAAPLNGGSHEAAYGVRAGAVFQWQTLQDGMSIALEPLGIMTSVAYNITPQVTNGAAIGFLPGGGLGIASPINDGASPGSAAEAGGPAAGIPDFVQWLRDPLVPGRLTTGFDLTPWEVGSVGSLASAGGLLTSADAGFVGSFDPTDLSAGTGDFVFDPSDGLGDSEFEKAVAALVGVIDVIDDREPVPTLYDQTDDANNDEDALNLRDGTANAGFPGDELHDAIDGTLLLRGFLENVNIENRWTADPLVNDDGSFMTDTIEIPDGLGGTFDLEVFLADPDSVRRTLSVSADIRFFDGKIVELEGLVSNEGTVSASWTDIPFTNTDGTDNNGGLPNVYDFIGDDQTTYSADLTFEFGTTVPEPLTTSMGVLAIAALGANITRRRRNG